MAISRVGAANYAATSGAVPAHQAGDLIIIAAFSESDAPSLGSGYTNIASKVATDAALRVGYMVADSNSEVSGTWTGADQIHITVYRAGGDLSIGASGSNSGSGGTTSNYPGLTLSDSDGSSWIFGAGVKYLFLGTNSIQNPPSGMTNIGSRATGLMKGATHDTNGGVTSWSSQNPTTSSGGFDQSWATAVVEIVETGSAADDIDPSLHTNTQTFPAVTIAPGAATVSPALVSDGDTFHAATVSPGAVSVTAGYFQDAQQFFALLVGQFYPIDLALFTNTNSYYGATFTTGPVNVTPELYTNAQSFFDALLEVINNIELALFTAQQVFHAFTVTYDQDVDMELVTNTNTFPTRTVVNVAYKIYPALLSNAQTFYDAFLELGPPGPLWTAIQDDGFDQEWAPAQPYSSIWTPINPPSAGWEPITVDDDA